MKQGYLGIVSPHHAYSRLDDVVRLIGTAQISLMYSTISRDSLMTLIYASLYLWIPITQFSIKLVDTSIYTALSSGAKINTVIISPIL